MSSEVKIYSFKNIDDLRLFRAAIRNIVDYGIKERLDMIKNLLSQCDDLPSQ